MSFCKLSTKTECIPCMSWEVLKERGSYWCLGQVSGRAFGQLADDGVPPSVLPALVIDFDH